MKRLINRRTAAWLLYYSGLLYLFGRMAKWAGNSKPLLLTGHRVLTNGNTKLSHIDHMALASRHAITASELEHRLKWVMRLRTPGNPAELAAGTPKGDAFYLTFDDGYLDNLHTAAPVLEKLGVKAIIFLVSDLVANPNKLPWWDAWGEEELAAHPDEAKAVSAYGKRCLHYKKSSKGLLRDTNAFGLSAPGQRLYLTIEELRQAGGKTFYFANHTATHANLTQLSEQEIAQEIETCSAALLGLPGYLPLLAYPFGAYDNRVLAYLHTSTKFSLAFATGSGSSSDRFCLRRLNLNTSPFFLFAAEFLGVFDFLSKISPSKLKRKFSEKTTLRIHS